MQRFFITIILSLVCAGNLWAQQSKEFLHLALARNTRQNYTILDHPNVNGKPDIILMVTPNFNPSGARVGVTNNHPIGVYYANNGWAVFNQDMSVMPQRAAFNVMAVTPGERAFVHRASGSNISQNCTAIDHASTNNNPNAILLVTANWNPGGSSGVYNNHAIGVYYVGGKWNIFNQDMAAIPEGAAFNVVVREAVIHPTAGLSVFVHRSTAANTVGHRTTVDDRIANFIGEAMLFVTPNWNPGGVGGVYNNHALGVEFTSGNRRWNIFNQDTQPFLQNSAFNVLVRWEGPQ